MYIGIEFSRGIAAFMVLASHYNYMLFNERTFLNFLWTGVDLFFVISGFVFSRLIYSKKMAIKPFAIRRFFRIYPLYIVALIIFFALSYQKPEASVRLLEHLLFIHTLESPQNAFFFNPAFWSLPVEIEYYLLIPLLVYIARFSAALWLIFALSIGFRVFLATHTVAGNYDSYYIMQVHISGLLPEFLIGIFLYQAVQRSQSYRESCRKKWQLGALLLGGVGIALLAYYFVRYGDAGLQQYPVFAGLFGILAALSYALLLYAICYLDSALKNRASISLLIAIGSISYPVYLIHNAAPKIIQASGITATGATLFILSLSLTIALSLFLHRCIEEPARLYGKKLSDKLQKPS
jgi:exopolysaccharide production protein ExoZ